MVIDLVYSVEVSFAGSEDVVGGLGPGSYHVYAATVLVGEGDSVGELPGGGVGQELDVERDDLAGPGAGW